MSWTTASRHLLSHLRVADHRPVAVWAAAVIGAGWALRPEDDSFEPRRMMPQTQQLVTRLDFAAATSVEQEEPSSSITTLLNWSGTHAVATEHFWEPETVAEVEAIVKQCHEAGQPVRPLGSALSPNGIGFHSGGMLSLANLDQILSIDPVQQTITVQAGARVSQVVEALRPYGLTLPNLASIAEQQMGGFTQVGAHGTGRCIAPVDHYVEQLKVVTPGRGTLVLTRGVGELLPWFTVALGCLGIVVEVTMKCIPAHKLVEHTFVVSRNEAVEKLDEYLKQHKHMRYMWIPYTDSVVVVTNEPESSFTKLPNTEPSISREEQYAPLTDLLQEVSPETDPEGMGFGEIRDALLAVDPLDVDHVKRCNQAEAEFWKRSEGYRIKPSDQLLQFECGGQQWVWEVCFPTGTQDEDDKSDMEFMKRLLAGIEERSIPAHSPIEQRWTASSSSNMSPAHGAADGLHSWVGIINYLPSDNERQRREITDLFSGPYCDLMRDVGLGFNATSHWAKIERPPSVWKLFDLQSFLESRFPLRKFNQLRSIYDPKNILTSPKLGLILGDPRTPGLKGDGK